MYKRLTKPTFNHFSSYNIENVVPGRKKRPTETTTTPRPRTTTAQPPGPKSKKSAVDVCKANANFDASYYGRKACEINSELNFQKTLF